MDQSDNRTFKLAPEATVPEREETAEMSSGIMSSPDHHSMPAGPTRKRAPVSQDDDSSRLLDDVPQAGSYDGAIRDTVRFINGQWTEFHRGEKEVAFAIGRKLIEVHDAEKRDKGKRPALRELADALKREGCRMQPSTLLQCVQLVHQNGELSESHIQQLTKTHLVVLLGVGKENVEDKLRFATEAVAAGWSSNTLLREIETWKSAQPGKARKRIPAAASNFVKVFRSAKDLLVGVGTTLLGAVPQGTAAGSSGQTEMSRAEAQGILEDLDAIEQTIKPMRAKLLELASMMESAA